MADNEKELRIKITTAAAGDGARKTAAELDSVGKSQEKAGKEAEKHTGHVRGLHKIFHALNEVVPGLGVAMQAAFSPVGATITLAVMAARLFHEKMKEANAEFKKMEEEAARPATNRMVALREATVQAAVGMNHLHQALEEAARSEQTVKETTERTSAAFKAEFETAQTLAAAIKDNELAQAEQAHAAGLASDGEYADARLEIERRFQDKKREIEERAEMTEILIRRRAMELAEMKQPELTYAAEFTELKKTKALEDLGSFDKAGIDERYKESQKKLKEFEEKNNDEVGWFEQAGGAYATRASLNDKMRELGRAIYMPGQFGNFDKWQSLKWEADASKKEWEKAPGEEAKRKVAADRASFEAEQAAKAATENQTFITATGRDIDERRMRFDNRKSSNQEISELQKDTAARLGQAKILELPAGKLLTDVSQAERTLLQGEHITLTQASQIRIAAIKLKEAHIAHGDEVLRALGSLTASTEQNRMQIIALAKQMKGGHTP